MTKLNIPGEKDEQPIETVWKDIVLLNLSHEKHKNTANFLEASPILDFPKYGFIIFGCRRKTSSPITTCDTIILEPRSKLSSGNLNDAFKIRWPINDLRKMLL